MGKRTLLAALTLIVAAALPTAAAANIGQDFGTHNLFIRSAEESADLTQVTFPLHLGVTEDGHAVYYVVTESSDRADAAVRRVNYAPKLENAKGTDAVQAVSVRADGTIVFPGTVDFSPTHVIAPGPTGFPPSAAQPGAIGDGKYSPLIELPNSTVLNAPQVGNATGWADKVLSVDLSGMKVTYAETPGFYDNRDVHYASFDSSSFAAAAIEDVTYAPNLDGAPGLGDASHASAREPPIAFTNGQTGVSNPNRQGLSSALLGEGSPLNTLDEIPEGQADPSFPAYSPLWDIHLAEWTPAAVAAGLNTRQRDFGTELALVADGLVTGPGGTPFGASGFIVNCPAVSLDAGK
jgi:hypothetical protein